MPNISNIKIKSITIVKKSFILESDKKNNFKFHRERKDFWAF